LFWLKNADLQPQKSRKIASFGPKIAILRDF